LLVKLGADPQRGTPNGLTPLHLAAMVEDQQTTVVLTALDDYRPGGFMMVGNASYWINYRGFYALPAVDLLLELGAKVDVRTKANLTPSDVAASPEIRQRLAKAGGKSGLTGLAAVVTSGDVQQLRKYAGKDDINATSVGGFTALTWALVHRQDVQVALLLKRGADPARRDAHGQSPFWLALSDGRVDLVTQFLVAGVSADTALGKEETPLAALRLGWYTPKPGTRPLALAIQGRLDRGEGRLTQTPDLKLLRLLLDFDANPNFGMDDSGWTPLHYAAASNNLEAVRLLVDHGANRAAKDEKGQTPLDALPKEAEKEIREVLRK
jgi:ankyrin repeat protein